MGKRIAGRDASGHVDPFAQRRKRFEAALRPVGGGGVWEMFAEMPRQLQEFFWKFKLPDTVVQGDETFPAGAVGRKVRGDVDDALRRATFVAEGGETVAVRDMTSIIDGLIPIIRSIATPANLKTSPRFVREALPLLEKYHAENWERAIGAMSLTIHAVLVRRSEIDRRLFTGRGDHEENERGKLQKQVILGSVEPQERKIVLDGKARTMYRAFRGGNGGAAWVSVSGAKLGHKEWPEEIPVFVQGHALEQLQKRANLPVVQPYLQAWLAESMTEPRVIKRLGHGALMVEYRIKEHRVGYLVVTPRRDCIIVRTFLFLTMENTPAARLLHKRLKLTRGDRDYLGLDELAAFTQTDLRTDPVLRPLMEKCGCGHLFALVEDVDDLAPRPTALAEKMKKYLRMAA